MTSTQQLAVRDRLAPELDAFARVGKWLAAAENPNPGPDERAAGAAFRLYVADQLGFGPLGSLEVSLIKGNVFVSAQFSRALADRAGYRVRRTELTDTSCTAQLIERESGEVLGEATFTLEEAKAAGLLRSGGAWTTYPRRMLWARASQMVVRDFAPSVLLGLRTEDERDEIAGSPGDPDTPAREPVDLVAEEPTEADWEPYELPEEDVQPDELQPPK